MQFLLSVSELFGDQYLTHIMLPVFLVAVGDDGDLSLFPSAIQSRIKGKTFQTYNIFFWRCCISLNATVYHYRISCLSTGLRPKTALAEKLAIMCVLPLLLAGILGAPSRHDKLADYLRKLLLQNTLRDGSWSTYRTAEIIDAVRFLWLVSLLTWHISSVQE